MNALVILSGPGPVALIGDIGGGELLLVMAAVLMLFGGKKLPAIARSLGKTLEDLRRASQDFRNQLMNADREFTDTLEEPFRASPSFKTTPPPANPAETPASAVSGTPPVATGDGPSPVPEAPSAHDSPAAPGPAQACAAEPAAQETPPRDLAG